MYIKLYLSELEKQHLEEIASKKGMSVSKLCYDQVAPLLRNPFSLFKVLQIAIQTIPSITPTM